MPRPISLPDREYLLECLSYCHLSGRLYWKFRPREHFRTLRAMNAWNTKQPGTVAGKLQNTGHIVISINKRRYLAHRIVFKMMTGEEPPRYIDHKNTTENDNRFQNLRIATHSQNLANRGPQKNNKHGFKGVTPSRNGFMSMITCKGKQYHLGRFKTAEEAQAAYQEAAESLFGEFARLT